MQFEPIVRASDAAQSSVSAVELSAIIGRVFGSGTVIESAIELGIGSYNSTYRVHLAAFGRPVILRIAPRPEHQFGSEAQLMRNEYASIPWLSPIAALLPTVLAADWSHQLIGRDYLVQSLLDGIPAPDKLHDYPRPAWAGYFRQLGAIAATVHAIRGPWFGPITGPGFGTLSEAVIASLAAIATDIEGLGLAAEDVHQALACAQRNRPILDEVSEPRMLAGDLWSANVMLSADADQPTIVGVFDFDRTWWGDPAADWTIRLAGAKPGTERDAFWQSYGPPDRSANAAWRSLIYEARHLGAIRLERHRLRNPAGVADSYPAMAAVLAELARR